MKKNVYFYFFKPSLLHEKVKIGIYFYYFIRILFEIKDEKKCLFLLFYFE